MPTTDTDTTPNWPTVLAEACRQADTDDRPDADARRQPDGPETARPAAVLIGIQAARQPAIYFTERSAALTHHPGQISFPGGRIEIGDGSASAAALREAREEIGLDPVHVTLLGELPCYRTVTGFVITPVVGWIDERAHCVVDGREVVRLFSVPLSVAFDADAFRYRCIQRDGRARRIYSLDHDRHHIWGATAAMLATLAHRVARVRGQDFVINRAQTSVGDGI